MSNISEVTANNSSSAYEAIKNAGFKDSTVKNTSYGKTIGKAKLSDEGAKYYEELKKKYSDMDFVLVSKDMKDYAKQHASSFGNANKMVVLIDEEKIERMATDADFRAKYEGLIANAQAKIPVLKSMAEQQGNVKAIGMQVNDNGTASYFAVMQKSSAEMSEKLAAKRAAKKQAEKAAAKKAEKKEAQEERLEKLRDKNADKSSGVKDWDDIENDDDVEIIMANSIEELQSKIEAYNMNLRTNSVQTPEEKMIGQSIDIKG
ncbi:DUF6033 family protein [Butyrivibrio sp. YAB3001]|uniref:DUF6033 family protein n=1 Tax=Butyrivibrio sp. YAB3001 TaxID=1520812 RepID=UPI0008F6251E|nr:DUF6033 family protein [Butyrivibrio sp. YAB3001]SFC19559.1 hypothetical protein SAMN02910398_01710 [Butyrivibrio sp. YAB3001]